MVKKKSINLPDYLNKKFERYRQISGAEFSKTTEIALGFFLDENLKKLEGKKSQK